MKALEILSAVTDRMTKRQILEAVRRAEIEMELLNIHQVAALVGQKAHNVRMRAINNGLGHMIAGMGRVYSQADVDTLKAMYEGGPRPQTLALAERAKALKGKGLTNRAIAAEVGVDPSYITRLLKQEAK